MQRQKQALPLVIWLGTLCVDVFITQTYECSCM